MWYRMPEEYSTRITKSADPFLLGILFTAMQFGQDVHVHGTISPSLLCNLDEFQKAWSLWLPARYQHVDLSSDLGQEQPRVRGQEAIIAFSGGADSTYSVWIRRPGHAPSYQHKLAAGLTVHGFDIPVEEAQVFKRVAEKNRRMLESVGMQPLVLATNLRELPINWEDFHGAALASCLMLFQECFNTGLIAGTYRYTRLVLPYGSNPITDHLLSNESFQIVHDGASVSRFDKMREINHWPEARQYLRVCWEGKQKDRNCCRCQKCIFAMLAFRAFGHELPACFPHDITDRQLMRLKFSGPGSFHTADSLINFLKAQQTPASTIRALRIAYQINRIRMFLKRNPLLKRIIQRYEYRWFLGPVATDQLLVPGKKIQ